MQLVTVISQHVHVTGIFVLLAMHLKWLWLILPLVSYGLYCGSADPSDPPPPPSPHWIYRCYKGGSSD